MAVHAERVGSPKCSKILTLAIDRPPVNALDIGHLESLTTHGQRLADDSRVRGVIITGTGGTFSAGVDTTEWKDRTEAHRRRLFTVIDNMAATLLHLDVPIGAAINGRAPGGGLVLALLADIRLVANGDHRLGLPEVAVGVPFPTTTEKSSLYESSRPVTVP